MFEDVRDYPVDEPLQFRLHVLFDGSRIQQVDHVVGHVQQRSASVATVVIHLAAEFDHNTPI